jgi:hypothetical protein
VTATAIAPKPTLLDASEAQRVSMDLALTFERLAKDPDVNVEKLERLIAAQERILGHRARAEFEAAFAEMQGELPEITERGEIEVDGLVRSKYARFEDIITIVRPILQKHGFALRFRNETLPNNCLRITGVLSHRSGHSEQDQFDCPPDASGKKNNIQAMGSTRSYGQRYTTIALLNIVSRGADDDGRKAGERKTKADIVPPAGYQDWFDSLTAVADNGVKAFDDMWGQQDAKSKACRAHLLNTNRAAWEALKKRAAAVTS